MVARATLAAFLCSGVAGLRRSLHAVDSAVTEAEAELRPKRKLKCQNNGNPDVEMLNNFGGTSYVGPVFVGKSELLAVYDTAFTGLAVFDAQCQECGPGHYYDHALSPTFQPIEEGPNLKMPFEDGECVYARGFEYVKEGHSAEYGEDSHMEIMVIKSCKGVHFRESNQYSAVVGLSLGLKDKAGHDTSFPLHMGYCRFTVCLPRDAHADARFVWEDIRREGTPGTFKVDLLGASAWAFQINSLTFNSNVETLPSWTGGCTGKMGCVAVVDSRFPYIALPEGILNTAMEMFKHPRFNGCPSDVFPSLDFEVPSKQYTRLHKEFRAQAAIRLPGWTYVSRVFSTLSDAEKQQAFPNTVNDNGNCQVLFLSTKGFMIEGRQVVILGQSFLREYSVQFNVMPPTASRRPNLLLWHAKENCEPDFEGTWRPTKSWHMDQPKQAGLVKEEVDITASEIKGEETHLTRAPAMRADKLPVRALNASDFPLPSWLGNGFTL